MGKIYGTCGHEIEEFPYRPVAIKNLLPGNIHTISWQTLCADCLSKAKVLGLLLETTQAQDKWLHEGNTFAPERYR